MLFLTTLKHGITDIIIRKTCYLKIEKKIPTNLDIAKW